MSIRSSASVTVWVTPPRPPNSSRESRPGAAAITTTIGRMAHITTSTGRATSSG